MATIQSLCVYCGSSGTVDEAFRQSARDLGALLASTGVSLVFGGGQVGLMGLIADAVLAGGGEVIGVIPRHLDEAEIGHPRATKLHVVDTMHTRKEMMFRLADAFAVLPGGLGTLDETFEILTWRQLHLHDKPIVIVDVGGYWQPLRRLFDHLIEKRFANPAIRDLFHVVPSVTDVLPLIRALPESHLRPSLDRL
ncbi:MAG: TIGR00730 family Rossman fold protein [Alphaproteobacteria bacterium]|nr:TIGR00730 family Rossman fold protein [Alphaproteobacteria bacterium]